MQFLSKYLIGDDFRFEVLSDRRSLHTYHITLGRRRVQHTRATRRHLLIELMDRHFRPPVASDRR
jgi:hypothetical protein